MIILTIGDTSRRLSDAGIEESWVRLRLRTGPASVASPGVHVRIDAPPISLNLSAGDASVLPDRPLGPGEAKVVALWEERGLDRPDFRGGQLLAFLHQLYDVLDQVLAVLPSEVAIAPRDEGRGQGGGERWHGRDRCTTSCPVGDSTASERYISAGARSSGG
jgi:hypothetical protein